MAIPKVPEMSASDATWKADKILTYIDMARVGKASREDIVTYLGTALRMAFTEGAIACNEHAQELLRNRGSVASPGGDHEHVG